MLAVKIDEILALNEISDTILLSDVHFLAGTWLLNNGRYNQAIYRLTLSAKLREAKGVRDSRYAKCLSNIAMSWFKVGDYSRALDIGKQAIKVKRETSGSDSSSVASNCLNLASIYLELNDSKRAIANAEAGLTISRESKGGVPTIGNCRPLPGNQPEPVA